MIHIYWGFGKGKTSTLNGSTIRAKGAGMSVVVFRFLKGKNTSEDILLKKLGINVYKTQSSEKFVFQMNDEEFNKTKQELEKIINKLKEVAPKYEMVILDEFIDLAANNVNLMTEDEIISLVNSLGDDKEILISGHTKLNKLFNNADLITEYSPTKHYFQKGVKARKGIEY